MENKIVKEKTKILLVIILIIGAVFLLLKTTVLMEKSPQQKVEELKKQNTQEMEQSGYNECVKEVNAEQQKTNKCISDYLAKKGYTDGLDCVQNYDNPICKNVDRYNAGIDAENTCNNAGTPELTPKLSAFDCLKLLNKN